MIAPVKEINLAADYTAIEYGPVHFNKRNVEMWLPQTAEVYSDWRGRRFHRSHSFTDYLLPTAWETPRFELCETVTPSPHHPLGAKGVGESPTVGSPAAYVNAVIDALAPYGVKNIDMPVTSDKVWAALRAAGVDE